MKKKFIFGLLIMLVFFPFVINASTIKDDVIVGEVEKLIGYSLISTSDGGYLVAGAAADNQIEPLYGNSGLIVRYPTVVKYNKDNQVEWTKLFDVDELGNIIDIAETTDGYVLIAETYRYIGMDPEGLENYGNASSSSQTNFIIKVDKKGDISWKREYVLNEENSDEYGTISSGFSETGFTDIEVNKDTYVVIGTKNWMPLVLKYDVEGNLIYEKNYIGGEADLNNLTVTEDGGYVIAGYGYNDLSYIFVETTDTGYGMSEPVGPFIIKFDKNDKVEWIQKLTNGVNAPEYKESNDSYGSMIGNFVNGISEIIQTSDGEYVIVGSFFEDRIPVTNIESLDDNYGSIDSSTRQAFIAKYKTDGTMRWIKFYKDLESSSFYDVAESSDGSLWVGGSDSVELGKMLLINYSSDGEVLSKKEITTIEPGENYAYGDYGFKNIEVLNNNKVVSLGLSKLSTNLNTSEDGDVTINGLEQPSFIYTLSEEYELEVSEDLSEKVDVTNDGNIYSIKVTSDKGYEVDKIIIKDKDGNVLDVEVTELEDGTYSFKLYRDVNVEVTFKETLYNPKTGEVNFKLCFYIMIILSTFGLGYLYLFRRNSIL